MDENPIGRCMLNKNNYKSTNQNRVKEVGEGGGSEAMVGRKEKRGGEIKNEGVKDKTSIDLVRYIKIKASVRHQKLKVDDVDAQTQRQGKERETLMKKEERKISTGTHIYVITLN